MKPVKLVQNKHIYARATESADRNFLLLIFASVLTTLALAAAVLPTRGFMQAMRIIKQHSSGIHFSQGAVALAYSSDITVISAHALFAACCNCSSQTVN